MVAAGASLATNYVTACNHYSIRGHRAMGLIVLLLVFCVAVLLAPGTDDTGFWDL
jgi:hypothetical protein